MPLCSENVEELMLEGSIRLVNTASAAVSSATPVVLSAGLVLDTSGSVTAVSVLKLNVTGVSGILEEMGNQKAETSGKSYDSLRLALRKQIQELRQDGKVRPDMFVDKPVDPDAFLAQVHQLIGN